MPTINDVIERVAKVKPCAYDDETLAGWLLDLEGQLREEFFPRYREFHRDHKHDHRHSHDHKQRRFAGKYPEDGDVELMVQPPWDRVYDLYLEQMIDFQNREYGNYNNALSMFENALDKFRKHWHRTHTHVQTGGFKI